MRRALLFVVVGRNRDTEQQQKVSKNTDPSFRQLRIKKAEIKQRGVDLKKDLLNDEEEVEEASENLKLQLLSQKQQSIDNTIVIFFSCDL